MLALIAAATISCNPAALFGQVASATGGAAWKSAGEVSAVGKLRSSGLNGTAAFHNDMRSGRYTNRQTLSVAGETFEVYDGRTDWVRDISGGVHAYDAWFPRALALTQAYLTRRAYLDPNVKATVTCTGAGTSGSDATQIVRVQPPGGVPATLAINTRTHLVESIAIRAPIETDVTTFADYRQVGRLVLPFTISHASTFEPENGDRTEVTRYTVSSKPSASDFQKPRETDNARMLANATSTTVPVALEGRQLLVWASINGRAPMPFILDTGGHAILDTAAAKILGVRGVGSGVSGGAGSGTIGLQYARVRSMRIGNAELLDQPMLVIPYPYEFYERGKRVPLAGILGLEWFERYATRIDYVKRNLTLTPLATFAFRGSATRVPIRFQQDMPLANATADGNHGWFGVDTGNAGLLILYGDYLRRTGLLAKYTPGATIKGSGTGGSNSGTIQTLSHFGIGGSDIRSLKADFTQMKTGSFSSWTEAGDLGLTVLSHFTPTFDYARRTLYLEPVTHPLNIPPNRSGIAFTKNKQSTIDVEAVRPNSPATVAGLSAGDKITAVNGTSAGDLSGADFLDLVTKPAGTVVRLTVRHSSSSRIVVLTLR
jgi:PDZ domain/Aspartyl protease